MTTALVSDSESYGISSFCGFYVGVERLLKGCRANGQPVDMSSEHFIPRRTYMFHEGKGDVEYDGPLPNRPFDFGKACIFTHAVLFHFVWGEDRSEGSISMVGILYIPNDVTTFEEFLENVLRA